MIGGRFGREKFGREKPAGIKNLKINENQSRDFTPPQNLFLELIMKKRRHHNFDNER